MSLPGPHPGPVSVISPPRSLRMHIHSFWVPPPPGSLPEGSSPWRDPPPPPGLPHQQSFWGGITWFHGTSNGSSVQLPITQQMRWGSGPPTALDVSEGTREEGGGPSRFHLFGVFSGPFPGPPGGLLGCGLLPSVPHPASTHPRVCPGPACHEEARPAGLWVHLT